VNLAAAGGTRTARVCLRRFRHAHASHWRLVNSWSARSSGHCVCRPRGGVRDKRPAFEFGYSWSEPRLRTGIGVSADIGGGVAGFTDQQLRNQLTTQVSGLWDARVAIGTHIPLGLELGYVGTAQNLNSLRGTPEGTLVGSVAEATLRYNVLPHFAWNPYVFAGVGYQRFDVQNMTFATADAGVKSNENLIEYPMGTGISYRTLSGFLVDLRGTFRAEASSTLVRDLTGGTYASAHWWEASGSLGYEF